MSNETQFIKALKDASGPLCDDCLAPAAGWNRRQQAPFVYFWAAEDGTVREA